ncbi:MAG: TRAP transporter small permease subunit [Bacteroidota bacterium]
MTLLDQIVSTVGKIISWSSFIMVIVIVVDVTLRYIFSWTSAASFELEWHLFAAIFLLGAAWTLQEDKHVRVDVFYHSYSERKKAWVNLLGTFILLLPFCGVGFWKSLPFVYSSFQLSETSPQPGGLPARFIIKSAIPLGFLLLAMQGVSVMVKCIKTIKNEKTAKV